MKRLLLTLLIVLFPSYVYAISPPFLDLISQSAGGATDACTQCSGQSGASIICEDFEGTPALCTWSTGGTNRVGDFDASHTGTFNCLDKGTDCLKVEEAATGGYWYIDVTGADESYFYMACNWVAATTGTEDFLLLHPNGSIATFAYKFTIITDGSIQFKWEKNGGGADQVFDTGVDVGDGWTEYRVYWDADSADAGVRLWVDGVEKDLTGLDDGTIAITPGRVRIKSAPETNWHFEVDNIKMDGSALSDCPT